MNPKLKVPVPVVTLGNLSAVVGFGLVSMQTPRCVTGAFPSEVTFPPNTAVESLTLVGVAVITVGNDRRRLTV